MRIIICEDDEAIKSMIKFKLKRECDAEVDTAADGKEAKTLLQENHYDLMISDIHMPYHSGLELVSFLRNDLKKNTPVLILSVEGMEDTVMESFSVGADDFLTKPFSPNELIMRVKKLTRNV